MKISTFDRIKAHVEAGQDINRFSEKEAVLYYFLNSYYQREAYGFDSILDIPGDAIAEELEFPLSQRPSGILTQLEWLLSHGADINAGGEYLPLMRAVGNLDVAMTDYLLAHGADPHFFLDEEDAKNHRNYYIDILDCIALDASFANDADRGDFDKILQIATLLAKHGVTDVHTHCISIDSRTNTVSVMQAKAWF